MPRGRVGKTSEQAKEDTLTAILKALHGKREGKRFSEVKSETGFHQSTLSLRLKELISEGRVEHDPIKRVYRISERGLDDLETRELIDIIEKSSRLILGSKGGASAYPDDDLIIKTSVAYSYPAIRASSLGYLKRIVHKYFMLQLIHELARNHIIDAGFLIGDKPLDVLVEQLRKSLEEKKQVLAFTLDLKKVSELMNVGYLKEVVRVAGVEDEHRIQSTHHKSTGYSVLWQKYALEARALEFIIEHGRASLSQLSVHLNIDKGEAESILDGLLVQGGDPGEMRVYDDTGNLIQSIKLGSEMQELKIPGGAMIKLKINRPEPLIVKSSDKQEIYYTRSTTGKTQ